MTGEVEAQYEAFPYPERDPRDEVKRLITGSPSLPQEMDHHLWGGARDWSRPLKALVAGGGTGDGLIQLCQMLTSAGRAYEVTYLDLSTRARAIAEERARQRCTSRRDSSLLIQALVPLPSAVLPSRLIAVFILTQGRPFFMRLKKPALSHSLCAVPTPDSTSMPASMSFSTPLPLTSGLGSVAAITTRVTPA